VFFLYSSGSCLVDHFERLDINGQVLRDFEVRSRECEAIVKDLKFTVTAAWCELIRQGLGIGGHLKLRVQS
jgi:hypothetical protein